MKWGYSINTTIDYVYLQINSTFCIIVTTWLRCGCIATNLLYKSVYASVQLLANGIYIKTYIYINTYVRRDRVNFSWDVRSFSTLTDHIVFYYVCIVCVLQCCWYLWPIYWRYFLAKLPMWVGVSRNSSYGVEWMLYLTLHLLSKGFGWKRLPYL